MRFAIPPCGLLLWSLLAPIPTNLYEQAAVPERAAVVTVAYAPRPVASSCTYTAGTELDLRVACVIWPSTSAYVPDADFPSVTSYNAWLEWLRLLLDGQVTPGHRVLCGLTLAYYSTDLGEARAAAVAAGYSYGQNETAVEICNGIVAMGSNGP